MSQNLFIDTHSELYELNSALKQLQDEYKSDINYDNNTIFKDDEESTFPTDDDTSHTIFTNSQVEEFRKIWNKEQLHYEESEVPEELNNKLMEQDVEAFQKKIKATPCCSKNCLINNIVDYEIATKKFQLFQKLNKNQQNMFLLGMLNANVRTNKTEKKHTDKVCLTSEYYFEGNKICMVAFLIIYGVGKKKWEAVRKHYIDHDISPIVHGLTGRKSNNAVLFETILQILTFINNYANAHGLPSPGVYFINNLIIIINTFLFN
jgi:hypothetical protein